MLKKFIVFLATICSSYAYANTSTMISISGVQPQDFQKVNSRIGKLVSEFKVRKFEVLEAKTQAFIACLEPNPEIDGYALWWEMNSVSVDVNFTKYTVTMVGSCNL